MKNVINLENLSIIENYLKKYTTKSIFYEIKPNFAYFFTTYTLIQNNSETNINHIFPVNYFSNWLSEEKKVKIKNNKNTKTREQSILVKNFAEVKSIKLQNFTSAKNIFTDNLEKLLSNAYVSENQTINTEKFESLDKILQLVNQELVISDFYIVFDNEERKFFHNFQINKEIKIHQNRLDNINKTLKGLSNTELGTYFTFLKAKKDFYYLCENTLNITTSNVINSFLKNKPKFINAINNVFHIFITLHLISNFTDTLINNSETKECFISINTYVKNHLTLRIGKDDQTIINFLKILQQNVLNQNIESSYLYAFINEQFIYDSYNYYSKLDDNLSYLILSSKKKLSTSEIPLFYSSLNNMGLKDFKNKLKNINVTIDNENLWIVPYKPNIIILSANINVLNLYFKLYLQDSSSINYFFDSLFNRLTKQQNLGVVL